MKAIILAAGEGKRLRPITEDRPKCMVLFHGKSIIDYQLETLHSCGIQDIIVVRGYCAEAIKSEGVRFVFNPLYANSNMVYSLFCAEQELTGDLIISYGDIVYNTAVLKSLLDCNSDIAITIDTKWRELWELRMEDLLTDAETLILDSNENILELGKKAKKIEDIQGQYMGLIKISSKIIRKIITFYHKMDHSRLYDGKDFNNIYMTSFLQNLIDNGFSIKAVPIAGGWVEIDSITDLDLPVGGI